MAKITFNWNDLALKYLGTADLYVWNISNIKVITEVMATEKYRIKKNPLNLGWLWQRAEMSKGQMSPHTLAYTL